MADCTSCGETGSLLFEEEGCVCSNCGVLVNPGETTWESGDGISSGSGRSVVTEYEIKNGITNVTGLRPHVLSAANRSSINLPTTISNLDKVCIQSQECVCNFLKLPDYIKTLCKDFYIHSKQQVFKGCKESVSRVLAGVCVYVKLREAKYPVTLKHISMVLGCDQNSFGSIFVELKHKLNLDLPTLSVEDFISSSCAAWALDTDVEQYMNDLTSVFRDVYVTDGTVFQHFMPALAYIAFMAKNIKMQPKLTVYQFCKSHHINYQNRTFMNQYKTMVEVLKILALNLPWVNDADLKDAPIAKPPKVLYFIDDILRHQVSIINEYVFTNSRGEVSSNDERGHISAEVGTVKRKSDVLQSIFDVEEMCQRKKRVVHNEQGEDFDEPVLHNLNSEELCSGDLSKQEEDLYLRSQNEIDSLKEHFGNYSESDEEYENENS